MTFTGFNFRSTLGFVTDGPNDVWAGVTNSSYLAVGSGGTGYGWTGTAPSGGNSANVNATNDVRIAGVSALASTSQFRVDVPNGTYTVRIGVIRNTGTAARIDVGLKVGAGSTVGVDIFNIDSGTATISNAVVLDAGGNSLAKASWAGSQATLTVTVTQGFFTILWGTTHSSGISHFAYELAATGATLTGQSVTSAQGSTATAGGAGLSGQAGASGQGSAGVAGGKTISGQSLTPAQGQVGIPKSFALNGQSNTVSQGAIAFGVQKLVPITGQSVAVNQAGPVTSGPDFGTSGQAVTVNQSGPVQTAMDLGAYGLGMAAGQGVLAGGTPASIAVTGQSTTAQQGTATATPTFLLAGQFATVEVANISGVPRHDIFYEISRGFDGGAFDPGGFYSSINPAMATQQGSVGINSNVPALRSDALTTGQGALSYSVTYPMPAQPMTISQGTATPTLQQFISSLGLTVNQGGDIYTFFPWFFDGTVQDVYVPQEENVLYVPQDITDMFVQ